MRPSHYFNYQVASERDGFLAPLIDDEITTSTVYKEPIFYHTRYELVVGELCAQSTSAREIEMGEHGTHGNFELRPGVEINEINGSMVWNRNTLLDGMI